MHSVDQQARKIKTGTPGALQVFDRAGNSVCPKCDSRLTHIVDVQWETDPEENDRRRVRLEFRCEEHGHGWLVLLGNHGGVTRMEYADVEGTISPFAEGVRW